MTFEVGRYWSLVQRILFLDQFSLLDATPLVQFIERYIDKGVVPPGNAEDAAHLALASIHEMAFICTWNFKHLANPFASRCLHQPNVTVVPGDVTDPDLAERLCGRISSCPIGEGRAFAGMTVQTLISLSQTGSRHRERLHAFKLDFYFNMRI